MLGDVNISAILDSFSVSYDKRVRPNYGGKFLIFIFILDVITSDTKHIFTFINFLSEKINDKPVISKSFYYNYK